MDHPSRQEDAAPAEEPPAAAAVAAVAKQTVSTPQGNGQGGKGAVEALRHIHDNQKFESEAREMVKALLAEKGEAHVQNMLQSEIQKVKKKESELASVKKKVTVTTKEVDELQMDIRQAVETKAEAERMCKVLQSAMKRRAELTEEAKKKMEEHRLSVQSKVEMNVSDIRAKYDERKQQVQQIMEENSRLREEVAQQKKEFDEAYTSYQESWKERESYVGELMRSYQQVTKEMELLDARLALVRRERQVAEEGKKLLQRQLEMYSTQLSGFSDNHTMVEAEKVAAQQREEGEARIAQLEISKKEANELRLRFDKEAAEWRAACAAARRELQKTEKAKLAAEKQCRMAQEKARQRASA
ncbi:hypothetical protein DQ04_09231010 [Trypanosoma grayi]|uniref:hypothetical protein n=1 Tax=Trypanosoma grayi TaxID=71804 RepID=UPI0004F4AA70|nr:hypothetical protein DQ04_09231010 [Trypanosoma grayi]KEG07629.1 hypothetical protein DQ04_09231010 [Trypanosoma grayi]